MHSWFIDTKEGMKVLKSNWNGPIMFYPEIHKFDTSTMQALITENEIESLFDLNKVLINIDKVFKRLELK